MKTSILPALPVSKRTCADRGSRSRKGKKRKPILLLYRLQLSLAHSRIAAADLSISASVVDQFDTEIRIACMPCQVVPPAQHVPSDWTRRITSAVCTSESAKRTN